ncbi:EamA family transporter [Coraliomargarita akajimensis]|uniref:EamA domain-containing protein n=1 Tax=Coraliomargarita akajimensis (strain DSM 45221 / IAM 15411 / JCM 23193 / KCTC 12865 / 04OKA010-24) TaxID=583355 RepID=D5EKW4_CORAD|nr:EamA family transporter [Coraliomargarita akajimensis]ADE55021.1 protein of unknown function DUF6 transmembrane [Coraliomargarita akajimensis DSM 45221]
MHYLLIVSLIWAFSFGLIGNRLSGVDPFFVASARLAIALAVFLPLLKLKPLSWKQKLQLLQIGAIEFGVMYICYIKAFSYLPSHLIALFTVLTPVYVVLIHDLQQKQFNQHTLIAALAATLGAAVIKAKGFSTSDIWLGFGLMQLAGIAFAYGQVSYRKWKLQQPAIQDHHVVGLLYLGGLLVAGASSILATDWPSVQPSSEQWLTLLYLGLVASGLGFFLWNKGASQSKPGTLGALNNAVVPLAMLCSLFIFGEAKNATIESIARLVIGASLISCGVWYAEHSKSDN